MPISIRGTPTVFTAETAASATTDADLIIRPPVDEVSVQQLVSNVLAAMDQSMCLIVDTANRRVFATDNATQHASYVTAVVTGDTPVSAEFTAISGDRVTDWEITNGFTGTVGTALNAVVAPVPPKYSVASLLTRILEVFDGVQGPGTPFIEVDQANGLVKVYSRTSSAEVTEAASALTALTPLANTKTMAFTIPAVTPGADQFFE